MSTILMFVGILLMVGKASAHYNKSYNGYTFILPDHVMDRSRSKPLLLSFSDAQRWCVENVTGSTLATISNRYVQEHITKFINGALQNKNLGRSDYDNMRLNGKFNITNEWRWVNGQPKTAGLTFLERYANTVSSFTACIVGKEIRIYSESDKMACFLICEYPGNSEQCDLFLNGRCYQKKEIWLQWFEARNGCLDGGGDLASFETLNDTNIYASLKNLSLHSTTLYSIGLQKNEWRWEDTGSAIKYANWYFHRQVDYNLRCICLTQHDWKWIGCDCSKPYPFICLIKDMSDPPAQGISTPADMPGFPTQEASPSSETIKLVILVVSCAVIFVIIVIIVGALVIKKRRNNDAPRALRSSGYVTPKHAVTESSMDFPVYEEIIQNSIPASDATYASVVRKVVAKTEEEEEHPVNCIVYADLDLKSRE